MKTLFLCGGVGKRMFPIVEDKFLLRFLGKTLLEHQIERAMEAGLRQFIMVVNPQNLEEVERISRSISGIEVDIAVQQEPLGIANALEIAVHLLEKEVIIVNPNDIFQISAYTGLLKEFNNDPTVSYMLGYEVKEYFPGGYLVTDSMNRLQRIVEKPRQGEEPGKLVNILLHLHTDIKKLLDLARVAETSRDDVYECALGAMVGEGHGIQVVPYGDFWSAIKYPWHILTITRHFLDRSEPAISPSAIISAKATIEGKVIIDDNVRILENAVVRGPAYIGARSIIGNNALVRDYSHIGADCVVGYCTEVKNSFVGDKCWFHSNYIGDSIIAEGCSFGAGTVLANFRFDEGNISVRIGEGKVDTGMDKFGAIIGRNSRTGINSSILPGVKIGPNSIVGPNVCLTRDLESNKMALPGTKFRIMENRSKLTAEGKKGMLMERLGDL